MYTACDVWCGCRKPLLGQNCTKTTVGQIQSLLIVLLITDVKWLVWYIVSVDNKFSDKCQWKLSFARAEIVLINSMTPIQQIVYHMLRFFVKTERLLDTDRSLI